LLVERARALVRNPIAFAALRRALLERQLHPDASAKPPNVIEDATPLVKRVHGASELTARAQLREHLNAIEAHAVPESDVARGLPGDLGINLNATKHLMTELGWSKRMVKWGGKDHHRAIWGREDDWVERGKLRGPGGFDQKLVEHLEARKTREVEDLK
jgi:hypothetical protein